MIGRTVSGRPGLRGVQPLFPHSVVVPYQDFHFELLTDGASKHPGLLAELRDDVLEVAARSRGWEEPDQIASFVQAFKIEPFFHTDGLALIWQRKKLVGLAGTVYDSAPDNGLVLHLCSVGLLPRIQRQGILLVLFGLLFTVVDGFPGIQDAYSRGRVYLTAITQNPFIIAFLAQISDLYPAPGRVAPEPDFVEVARKIVDRFDPEVAFDPQSFILRNECAFFYRTIPYSPDQRVNDYCDERLRYDEGDTFALVGRARREAIQALIRSCERAHPNLFGALVAGLAGERRAVKLGVRCAK